MRSGYVYVETLIIEMVFTLKSFILERNSASLIQTRGAIHFLIIKFA